MQHTAAAMARVALAAVLLAALVAPASGHAVVGSQRSLRVNGLAAKDALVKGQSGVRARESEEENEEHRGGDLAASQQAKDDMDTSDCKFYLIVMAAITICSPIMTLCCSIAGTPQFGFFVPLLCFIAMFTIVHEMWVSGTMHKMLDGEKMNFYCMFLGLWSFFLTIAWTCQCCMMCCFTMVSAVIIAKDPSCFKNVAARKVREKFDEMSADLSQEQKDYYCSRYFKDQCDRLFEAADQDGNGSLDVGELREAVLKNFNNADLMMQDELFILAFDKNGDSSVDKDEFYEMMKYFDMTFQKQRGTAPSGFARYTSGFRGSATTETKAISS